MEKHNTELELEIDAKGNIQNTADGSVEVALDERMAAAMKAFMAQPYLYDLLMGNLPYLKEETWADAAMLAAAGDEIGLLKLISSQYDCRQES